MNCLLTDDIFYVHRTEKSSVEISSYVNMNSIKSSCKKVEDLQVTLLAQNGNRMCITSL